MTTTSRAIQATELLLASIYYERSPERSPHSFFYNRPGQHPFIGGMGIELNYDDRAMTSTVLFLRRHGAPYLRALSVSEVRSTLTKFVTENFWTISDEAWGGRSAGSFASFLSAGAKAAMAGVLAASDLFVQPRLLTLFPLSVVRCDEALIFDDFFLVPPSALTPDVLQSPVRSEDLAPTSFPPFVRSGMRSQPVASWLGIWAPNFETAKRMRATVLGAVALLPHPLERYSFSGRTLTAGRCTLRGGAFTESLGEPHTPALGEDIVLTADDRNWLEILAQKLTAPEKANKRQMRSLEYQYRSWIPDASRRFGSLFGALDAIYGDASQATQSVVDAVGPVMGSDYDIPRLKLLLSLRASVIHGGAPNVYESGSYQRYYENYYTDATRDLELIVARCLQIEVFEGSLVERQHTYADLLFRETGRRI